MEKLLAFLFAGALSLSLFGCADPTEQIDICGQEISVQKDENNEVVIEIMNCVSSLDGYEYPADLRTITGNPDVLAVKAASIFNEYRETFPDCQFKVISVNNRQVEESIGKE